MQRPSRDGLHDHGMHACVLPSPYHATLMIGGNIWQPTEFYNAVTASLQYLDTQLPAGSFVLFIGLVDGRVLWNTMNGTLSVALSCLA